LEINAYIVIIRQNACNVVMFNRTKRKCENLFEIMYNLEDKHSD